tara:strand:+ start:1155 stop:4250 length:3096 start_codon:yes stop_codon:yes gene_type:complete
MASSDKQRQKYAEERKKNLAEETKVLEKQVSLSSKLSSFAARALERDKEAGNLSKEGISIAEKLNKTIEDQISAKEGLSAIDASIADLMLQQVKTGTEVNSQLLKSLEAQRGVFALMVEKKDVEDEALKTQEASEASLYNSLGTLGEMLKAGTAIGFAMAALKGVTEAVGAVFETTIGFASDLNKELGISGEQAAKLGMQNFSLDVAFSRFSVEELNTATKDFAETMGTTAGITNDLRNSMAEMSKMGVGGENAAKLAQSFESAGGSAEDMTSEIKQMANDAGVMASTTMKDLASQQHLMLGATEAEIKALAKKTIELNKQGVSLEQMRGISESMMDIEGSMKAQAKARIMLQGKLSNDQLAGMTDMTAAALEFQRTGNMDVMTDALKRVKMSSKEFADLGPKGMEVYAQSIGMTAESLSDVIRKQEQMSKVEDSLGSGAASALEAYQRVPQSIKDGVTALISFGAQQMVISKMQTGSFGIGNMLGKKSGGGGGGDALQTEVPGSEPMGKTESGGGLKSLAEGLREMGDGKVFAGIGAVALAGPAFIIALPSIPFLLFMGKVKLKEIESNFTGLAAGLNSMASTFVGSAALAVFGLAAVPSILSIPFLTFMGKIKLQQLSTNLLELGIGLQMMASTFVGSAALAAFGLAGGAAILAIPFIIAIALGGAAAGVGLSGLAAGLAALGAAAIPAGFIGVGLIAALGVAMIPFAFALSLVTPLIEAFGNIIIGVMGAIPPIIGAIAEGFVTMMGAISLENIGALFLLGPALLSASVGMMGFGAAMLFGAPAILGLLAIGGALALLAPNLETFGNVIVNVMGAVPQIIQSIAEGFVTMMSAISPENVVGLAMLGPALLSASVGMIAFSAALAVGGLMSFFGGGVMDSINELSTVGPGLKQAGDGLAAVAGNIGIISKSMIGLGSLVTPLYALGLGLMSISAGLTSIAFSGLLAMPIFAALGGLAVIAPVLESLGSAFSSDSDESTGNDSMDKVVDAINKLSGEIASQPIMLNIDGKGIQQISRAQSRQSSTNRGAR